MKTIKAPKAIPTKQKSLRSIYHNHLIELAVKLEQLLSHDHSSLTSPQKIHQIRVTLTRLQTAIYLARHANKSFSFRKLDKDLEKLCESLSKKRDLDVATKNAESFSIKIPHLRSRLRKAKKEAQDGLSKSNQRVIKKHLHLAIRKIQCAPHFEIKKGLKDLNRQINPWLNYSGLSEHELHKFRLKTKKLRYSLEMIDCPQEGLQRLQKHLGYAHDLAKLQTLTGFRKEITKRENLEKTKAKKIATKALKRSLHDLEFYR